MPIAVLTGDDGTVFQPTTLLLPAATQIGGQSVVALGTITATSATAFGVGRQGATNPALNVNTVAASGVTGITIVAAAAASGVDVTTTSSGTNESMRIDAKGSGTILLNGTATGAVVVGDLTTPAFSVIHTTEGTGVVIASNAAASGVSLGVTSSGTDESLAIQAKGAGTVNIAAARATPAVTTITGDGAITIQTGTVFLTKGSTAAITLAAPSSNDGVRICIIGASDFAHVVTFTGTTLLDGTTGANLKSTLAAFAGSGITVIAKGTNWYVESNNLTTITTT